MSGIFTQLKSSIQYINFLLIALLLNLSYCIHLIGDGVSDHPDEVSDGDVDDDDDEVEIDDERKSTGDNEVLTLSLPKTYLCSFLYFIPYN